MGRRYDTAFYAGLVDRIRSAVPGVASYGDVIVGFPGEDESAWERSRSFIASIGFAGLHVFRYSARPGMPAVRMRGQVDEATRKQRSAELLAHAAERRAAHAAARVGALADVLFETELPDGRWVGHAEDHTLVAAPSPDGLRLENVIATVAVDGIDPLQRDRAVGTVVDSRGGPHAR